MATIRLIPSTYSLSSTYLSIDNAANMYNNVDNSTYATVKNTVFSTSAYHVYIKGFNFSDIPSDAIINSFTIKVKVKQSGVSTNTSYRPYLVNNTTTITGNCDVVTTTEQILTFTGVTADWDTIKGYGSNFGIRLTNRRSNLFRASYLYIYGAEILVDYTIPEYYNVTTSKSGTGTINPEGTKRVVEGNNFNLIITPGTRSYLSSVTDNGVDVTSSIQSYDAESYIYTVSSVAANHSIIVVFEEIQQTLYLKENGAWKAYSKAYKKVNGSWVLQTDLSSLFDTNGKYIKMN